MSTVSTCIFPETVPGEESIFPLVQVFSRVVYTRAVEDDEIPAELVADLLVEMEEAGICVPFAPAPLGEDRERFLALVRDLRERGDDYAAQLKNLSLAGMGPGGGGEVKSSIVGTLLKSGSLPDAEQEERQMLLWQARLLLKLAENYDGVQLALQRDLERINRLESGLLSQLREDGEQPWELTRTISSVRGHGDGLQSLRLKAWSRLLCLGEEEPRVDCFVTANRDAADLLAEQYERLRGQTGQGVVDIELPTLTGGWNRTAWEELRNSAPGKELRRWLGSILRQAAPPEEKEVQEAWHNTLEIHWPASAWGRCSLRLTRFADIGPRELFMAAFGRDREYSEVETSRKSTGLVIGLLDLDG